MKIPRHRDRDEIGELMSLAIYSFTIPQESGYEVDAISCFTGQGENERVIQPAKIYWQNPNSKNRFFLVPGFNSGEKTWKEITLDSLSKEPFNLKRLDGVHVEPHMGTTKDQAEWTVKKIKELSIKSCGIVSTPFHMLRSYTTTIATILRENIRIPIIPLPAFTSPRKTVDESTTDAWALTQGEIERILAYQKKGDVVTYDKFREYINWLWDQPLLSKYL